VLLGIVIHKASYVYVRSPSITMVVFCCATSLPKNGPHGNAPRSNPVSMKNQFKYKFQVWDLQYLAQC
jgi:hypothetical protein